MKILQRVCAVVSLSFLSLVVEPVESKTETEMIKISAESLKQEMDERNGVLIINVLNKNTYKDCAIQGSLHVPVQHLPYYAKKKVRKGKWSFDQEIVIYCASADCPLSRYAYKLLKNLGFTNVKLFRGGMREWKQKGYPCKGKARAGYLKG